MLVVGEGVKEWPKIGAERRPGTLLPDISNRSRRPRTFPARRRAAVLQPTAHGRCIVGASNKEIHTMADDLSTRGPQDATRIDVNEAHEVRYWTQTLGVTEAQLRSAVAAAGVEVKDIRTYLGKP